MDVGDMTDTRIRTMREFYIQYYTKTLLTIGDWKEWEQTPLPAHRFNFGDTTVAMRDYIRRNHSPLGSPHLTTRHSGGWIELCPDHFDKSLSSLLCCFVGA